MSAGVTVQYFHQADDPFSHLAAQLLGPLTAAYDIALEVHLVPPPEESAAPDRERLADWSLRDAVRLAAAHGLAGGHLDRALQRMAAIVVAIVSHAMILS